MVALSELLKRHQNRDAFGRIVELAQNNAITPFVGAGLSYQCGLPLWGQFLLELANGTSIASEVRDMLASGAYIEATARLQETLRDNALSFQIAARFGRLASHEATLSGTLRLLPAFAQGPVLTTNFDQLLERTYKEAGAPFERAEWGWKPGILRQALVERRHILVKLHGDAEDEGNRVLTHHEYIQQYGDLNGSAGKFDPALPVPLALARAGMGSLLFLGCSLNRDRTLEVLAASAAMPLSATHYALLEEPADEASLVTRASALAEMGIRPLWYPRGEHDSIELIIGELARLASRPAAASTTPSLEPAGNAAGARTRTPATNQLRTPPSTSVAVWLDDDAFYAAYSAAKLSADGIFTLPASTEGEVLKIIADPQFQVGALVTDVVYPSSNHMLSGLLFCQQLKAEHKIAVIGISVMDQGPTVDWFHQRGDGFFSKSRLAAEWPSFLATLERLLHQTAPDAIHKA